MSDDCLFCKIVSGDVPAEVVAENEHTVAFRDISPHAASHVLVVPREHHPDVASLAAARPEVAAALLVDVAKVAQAEGSSSFRLVFNTGPDAGQTVFHCHGHVLSGEPLGWPPR